MRAYAVTDLAPRLDAAAAERAAAFLGGAFAIFGGLAGFGIGNMVQVNSMAQAMETTFGVPMWITVLGYWVIGAPVA